MFQAIATSTHLTGEFYNITAEFGIDWHTVAWIDLEVPMYSGLAAGLYLVVCIQIETIISCRH